MLRKIIIPLLLPLLVICSVGCDFGRKEPVSSADQIKSQIDSSFVKHDPSQYSDGKQLFNRYCNSCHYTPEKNVLDQYTFDNLFQRLPTPAEDYFIKFISDSKALKASGNEYAKKVDEVYNSSYEHHFKDSFSKEDFTNLITFIQVAAKRRYAIKGS